MWSFPFILRESQDRGVEEEEEEEADKTRQYKPQLLMA